MSAGTLSPGWADSKVKRRLLVMLAAVALLVPVVAIVTNAVANHFTTAGTPELFNLEHVYNFNPGDHDVRGALGSTVGSDLEMFTSNVPLRDYASGELVDETGAPLPAGAEPVYGERDFAVMGSYDRGGYIFDITDPENPEFVSVAPCRQPRNDVGIKKFEDPVTGGERVVLALTQQTGTPCPNLDVAGGGDPAGVLINSSTGGQTGDLYDLVQWGDTAPLANQTADLKYAGTGCSPAQYGAYSGGDPLAFQGKIAIVTMRIDRQTGTEDCPTFTFFQKVQAAEQAGAIGFINVDEDDIPRTGVTAVTATIPGVEISNSDGMPLVDELLAGGSVNATLTPGTPAVPIFGTPSGSGGIGVFDITDPAFPQAMYRVMTAEDGVHNFIFHPEAPFGYVSPGELPGVIQDMPIIDFTNLDAPTVKEGADAPQTPGGIHDAELSINGDHIYAASENNYHIYDNSDPANPVPIGATPITPMVPATPTSGSYAHGLFPDSGQEIMVGQVESIVAGGFLAPGSCPGEGLQAYDISGTYVPTASKATPAPLGAYTIPVVGDPAPRFCTSHFGRFAPGTRIFSVGWYIGGVRIVDFSDPLAPVEVATAVMADAEGTSNTWAAKLYKGPYVFAGDMERGFDVFRWTGEGDAPWDVNRPPKARDDSAEVAAAGSVNIDVKANDSDFDHSNAELTVTIESAPASGTATVEADGTVTYSHNGDGATGDSFVYRLTDPEGASDTATVTITIDQSARDTGDKVTGGGWLATTEGEKANFGFNAKAKAEGLQGNLSFQDKGAGVKVKLDTVTSLGGVDGACGQVVAGPDSAQFTGTGTYNGAAASFRVCVADLGEPGNSGAGGADMFYLECTDGCSYSTGNRAADDIIDGGNIQVHRSPQTATASAASEPGVLVLDPLTMSQSTAGLELLTVTVYGTDSEPLAGAAVTLESTAADGSVTTLEGVSDAAGLAAFSVTVSAGDVEHIARSGGLTSNAVAITGIL